MTLVLAILLMASGAAPKSGTLTPEMKRAMSDVRAAATCMEAYAVDNNVYPGPTAGLVNLAELRSQLEPIYIKTLPTDDPWNHPYYVWSDGKSYVIVSGGADGRLDRDYRDAAVADPGRNSKDTEDIVFANGQFARWFSNDE